MQDDPLGHGASAPSVRSPLRPPAALSLSSILLRQWPSLRCLICLWLSTSVVDGNSAGYRLNPHQDQTWAHTATKQAPLPGGWGGDYTHQISPVASHHPWGEFKLPKRQRKPPYTPHDLSAVPSLARLFLPWRAREASACCFPKPEGPDAIPRTRHRKCPSSTVNILFIIQNSVCRHQPRRVSLREPHNSGKSLLLTFLLCFTNVALGWLVSLQLHSVHISVLPY